MNTKAPCSPSADIDKAMEGLQQLLETIGDPDHGSVTSLPTSSPDRSAHVGHSTDPQLEKSGLSMSHPDTPVASLKQKPPDVPQPNPLSHTEQGNTHESLVSNSAGETNRSPQSVNQKPGNSVTFSLPEYGQRVINRPGYHGVPNDIVGEPAHLPNSCTGEVDIKRNVTEHNWRDSMDEPRLLLCPAPIDKDATHLSVSRDNVFAGKQKYGPGKTSVGNGTPTGVEVDVPMSCPHPRTLDQTDGAYGDHDSTSESGSYDFTPDDAIRALNRKEEQMKLVDKLFPNYPDEVPKFTAPDGGYAWVVLAASFLLQGITIALPLSFGVLYLELLSYFEDSNTKTAWIGSIAAGFGLGAGPISSILCNYVGYRLTCIIGGLVAALGLFVSSFAPNVYMLCGSFGVLTGLGVSMSYIPAVVIIGYYFDKRRTMANGIACAGVAAGALVYPLLIEMLIVSYTWRGAMIVLSGVMLNCCVLGLLLRPTRYCKLFRRRGKTSILNGALLSDWRFCLFCLSEILWNIGSLVFLTSAADHANLTGKSDDNSVLLLSITGIGGFVGRIVMAFATNPRNCNRPLCLAVATLITVIPMALFTVSDLYSVLAVHCLVYGLGFGFQLGLLAVVTAELFTLEKLTSAYGYVMFADGIGGFIGPFVTGVLFDYSKMYFPALLFGASVSLLAAVIFFILVVDQFLQHKTGGEMRGRPDIEEDNFL